MRETATAIFCLFVVGCLAPPHWWQAIRNLPTFLRGDSEGHDFTGGEDIPYGHPERGQGELSDHEETVLADLEANWGKTR